ncbi:MAG: 4Fe-4S single cluster domain-containing protein, partial [Verrucomicrobiota bacterium]
IWVQGCPWRCPGCCNPQYLEFRDAEFVTPQQLSNEVLEHRDEIEGVTFIGGEPFSQASSLAELAESVQNMDLSVMIFTGHLIDDLTDSSHRELLAHTDLLVDGHYDRNQPDRRRRWIGSTNQRVHFLSERYNYLKDNWPSDANTLEFRLKNGQVTVNGFPHPDITKLSRLQARAKV